MIRELLKGAKITEVVSATATGTTEVNSAEVDMQDFEHVVFITSLGTANAANGHKIQQDTATGMAGAADLLDSKLLCNGTGKVLISEIVKPRERFVRCVVIRAGATTTVNNVMAIQFGARKQPVDNTVTNASAAEVLTSPAEGTA
ncbi:MAG: hypothetical protein L0211_06910 [Planctomycetaceae bacterium]|nr:hypothetical protein [Planctomycetaceae bacterium]